MSDLGFSTMGRIGRIKWNDKLKKEGMGFYVLGVKFKIFKTRGT